MDKEKIARQAKQARLRKRFITDRIGVGRDSKYPRCPHKSKRKVKMLREYEEELGERVRCDDCELGGICNACGCTRIAGHGTNHYGLGFCNTHEEGLMPETADKKVDDHAKALATRNPALYDYPEHFIPTLTRIASKAEEEIEVLSELNVLRSLMQKAVTNLEGGGLTEMTKEGPVSMTDKTKYTLISKLATDISKLAVVDKKLKEDESIHREPFEVWLKKFVDLIREYIDEDDLWAEFVKRMGKEVGVPMFGNQKKRRR